MGLFGDYELLPGGQRPGVPRKKLASKRRGRQTALYSGGLLLLVIVVVGWAYASHPDWKTPVGQLSDIYQSSGTKYAAPAYDEGDSLPRIDWSWDEERGKGWLTTVPKIGSERWERRYPGFVHGPAPRKTWLERYNAAMTAGLIPNLPKGELRGGLSHYPEDLPIDNTLCSYRRAGCLAPSDIWHLPSSKWAVNFDDGPLPPSKALYDTLDKYDEKATHFWVGHNVKKYHTLALQAARRGDHLAVHTWSHLHLTTYTNEQVIGELGWTMQIIYDISGYLPKYYRPPFGDVDNRIRALATHVFNITAVMWNDDTADWALNQTWAVGDFIDPPYDWMTTEKATRTLTDRMAKNDPNGHGVIFLEHELSFESIQAFTDSYPNLATNGWTSGSVAELLDAPWYQ